MSMKKYELLIQETKNIISQYDMKLTIRQVYYRLVSNQIIANNRSQYTYFDKVLTEYRQKNLDFCKSFEDKTRNVSYDTWENYPYFTFNSAIECQLRKVKTSYPSLTYNKNLLQNEIPIIIVEKQALESIFENAIRSFPHFLIVCRGFNSFTQMYELREALKAERNDRKFFAYIFTDFDDSGLLIQNNFLNQMRKYLKTKFESAERIALTKTQIEGFDIPTNPTKKSTHSKYNLPYFVELDALEPNILTDLVQDCCKKHFDKDLWNQIDKTYKIRNRRLKNRYFKELKKIDLLKKFGGIKNDN